MSVIKHLKETTTLLFNSSEVQVGVYGYATQLISVKVGYIIRSLYTLKLSDLSGVLFRYRALQRSSQFLVEQLCQ